MKLLPPSRGPLSEYLLAELVREPHELSPVRPEVPHDPLTDEDLHVSLYLLYELHYRGLPGVDDRWEWSPDLLRLRAELERLFEQALLDAVALEAATVAPEEIDLALREVADEEGPGLARHIQWQATVGEVREFLVHRSAYQLKE